MNIMCDGAVVTYFINEAIHYLTVVFMRTIQLRCRYTIRFTRAEPADCPVRRPIVKCGMLVECSGPMKIGWLSITARSILQPILSHLLCDIICIATPLAFSGRFVALYSLLPVLSEAGKRE